MADDPGSQSRPTRRHILAYGGRALAGAAGISGLRSGSAPALAQVGSRQALPARRETPAAIIVGLGVQGLPPAVVEMRSEILSAVERGEISELKHAIDLNELKPEVGAPPGVDAVEHLRSASADGRGASVLLHLGRLLEGKWASIPGGRDIENNRVFVWPHFAEVEIEKLDAKERADLAKLVGEPAATTILQEGKWRGWRLMIGADGVWHSYVNVGG